MPDDQKVDMKALNAVTDKVLTFKPAKKRKPAPKPEKPN